MPARIERYAITIFPPDRWGRKRKGGRSDGEDIDEAKSVLIEALIDSTHPMADELVRWLEDADIRIVNYRPLPAGNQHGKHTRRKVT